MRSQNKNRKKPNDSKKRIIYIYIAAIAVLFVVMAFVFLNRSGPTAVYTPVTQFSDIHGLAVDPGDPKILYVGTHFGLVRGMQDSNWMLVGNYRADFMGFTMHPNGRTFYASGHKVPDAPFMGLVRSVDGGLTWETVSLRGKADFHTLAISRSNPQVLYAWYYRDGRLYKSIYGGKSWQNPKAEGLSKVTALSVDPSDENMVWAGTEQGLYRSTDSGEKFELVGFQGTLVTAVALAPLNPQLVYVSTQSGLYKSTDGGQGWSTIGSGLEETIAYLAIDPTTTSTIYGATDAGAIYKSTDGGLKWNRIKAAR